LFCFLTVSQFFGLNLNINQVEKTKLLLAALCELSVISTEENKLLLELGLTSKQSKIYLANLKTGLATAKEISKISRIAREDVYRTIPSLENLGLIIKHLGNPAYYEAIEPKECFKILLSKIKKDYVKLNCRAQTAVENIDKSLKTSKTTDESLDFTYISPTENLEVLIKNAKEAKQTIDFTSKYSFFAYALTSPHFYRCLKELQKALKRRVKIRTIINKPVTAKPISNFSFPELNPLLDSQFFEYRHVDKPILNVIVYDNKKCLIELSDKQDVILAPFLLSNNKILVELCKEYFDKCWKKDFNQQLNGNYLSLMQ
jgi:sugar-specific transcriptional regulator TrmB